MSFRKQLKATFKELFGSGGRGTEESKNGGKKNEKPQKGRSATAELVRSPFDVVIPPALPRGGSSRGVTYFPDPWERSQERVPSYSEANTPSCNSVRVDVKKASEVPVGPELQGKDIPLALDPVPAERAWTEALSLLTTQDRLDLFHQSGNDHGDGSLDEQAIISTLLNQSHDLQVQAEARAFSFTNPLNGAKVNFKSKIESFITRINTYVRLGDIAIQNSPEITALVWTGVRLVISLIVQDSQTWGILVETMDGIAGVMGRCRIYEKMYASGVGEGARRVQSALVALYASLLVFAVKTKRYFAKRYIQRLYSTGVKPFEIAFGPVIESMRKCEARVEVEARAAAEEAAAVDRGKMMDLLGSMSGVVIPELKLLASQTNIAVQRIRKVQEETERLEILQWLSKVKYFDNHKTPAKLREKGTGEWLFDRTEWKAVFGDGEEVLNWWDQPLEDTSSVEVGAEGGSEKQEQALWLYGLPGTGKTILTSLVIDHLNTKCKQMAAGTTSLLAYFYCSYTEAPRKQATSLLATIVKQLAISLGNELPAYEEDLDNIGLPKSLTEAYRSQKQDGFNTEHLDAAELEDILFNEILSTPRLGNVYIVIDAMDEMEERERKEMFPILQRLVALGAKGGRAACKVKLFIASRGGQRDLKLAFGKDGWRSVGLEKSDTGGDIRKYVESQVATVIEAGELLDGDVDDGLREEIVESLVKGAEGMFLWVRYQIANLCEQETEHDVQVALKNLPRGIEETYTTLLERINAQSGSRKRLAYSVLQWMMYATRPMTPQELVEAVAIDPITDKYGIDAKKMVRGVEAIVDICGNFISYDDQLGVLRFVHFTVQEFLEKHLVHASGPNSNATVLQVCLALLCFRRGWRVLGKDDVRSYGTPTEAGANERSEGSNHSKKQLDLALAEYAVLNWGHHGRLALQWLTEYGGGHSAESIHTALKLFLSPSGIYFENWLNAFSVLSFACRMHILDARIDRILPNQLFICVYFGFPTLFTQSLVELYPELANPSYSNGWTHFHFAAALGAHHMISPLHHLLAVSNIDINTRDVDGGTPLHTIASSQRGGRGRFILSLSLEESLTTKALLQYGCDPTLRDTRSGNFPVHIASEVGNLSVLRALLVYCSPTLTSPENMSKVPKFSGSFMLEKQRNVWGYTPLHITLLAKSLHAGAKCEVAMHLLALGGHDVNARDSFMMTPLEKIMKGGLQHEIATLGQFLYDCGGLWDTKKAGLKKLDLTEWGKGGIPVMMFHSPMVPTYRIIAGLLPGRTLAQAQTMVMHQMGGRGRIDRGFHDRCFRWCQQERGDD